MNDLRDTASRRAGELAETGREAAKQVLHGARKAAYAVAGAPVVVGRRLASYGGKMGDGLRHDIEASIDEGEKLAARLRDRRVVEEIRERMDVDHLQDRVERLRDQLEDVLAHWRENFRPHEDESPATAPPAESPEPGEAAAHPADHTEPEPGAEG